MKRMSTRIALVGAAALLTGIGASTLSAAASASPPDQQPTAAAAEAADTAGPEFAGILDEAAAAEQPSSPDPAAIAEDNKVADELAGYLQAHDIPFTATTDEAGYRWIDVGEDEASTNAVDDFYWERAPMSAAEIAGANAATQALATQITAAGGQATVNTDRHGLMDIDTDWSSPVIERIVASDSVAEQD